MAAEPPSLTAPPFLGLGTEAALRTIADALPDGVFTTDVAGRVTYWNGAAERITGWTRAEALGRDCSLLAGDAVNGCSCGAGPVRCGVVDQGGTSKSCTVRTRHGHLLQIVKNAVPLVDGEGRLLGTLESFAAVKGAPVPGSEAPAGDFCGLVGRHPAMQELYRTIGLVARSGATVMLLGESGSGKERVAEAIHQQSPRANGPYVRASCAALDENLLQSELFGHVKGAFPGALEDRRGRFQEAHGGTLLLDEIGDVSPAVQGKLLRVIEQRELERLGDPSPIRVDVRLVSATHRDLRALVDAGRFRADLYFRLAVFPVRVPPLREHVEDLPTLAEAFLAQRALRPSGRPRSVLPPALAALAACTWAGNVRELHNVLEFAALQAGDEDIGLEHLPREIRAAAHAVPSQGARPGGPARAEVVAALEACGWNRAAAARKLGVSRVTMWKWIKRLGISAPQA